MTDKNVFTLGKIPSNKQRAGASTATVRTAAEPVAAAEREFVEAARSHTVPAPEKISDWESLDPADRPTRGINVRFNDYELGLLHHVAKLQDRSVCQTIKRLLIPAAHQLRDELELERDGGRPSGLETRGAQEV
jgi:hypothetical protein